MAIPNWAEVYKGCVGPTSEAPQQMLAVTRHTLELASSAISSVMEREAYHNYAAAHAELHAALDTPEGDN